MDGRFPALLFSSRTNRHPLGKGGGFSPAQAPQEARAQAVLATCQLGRSVQQHVHQEEYGRRGIPGRCREEYGRSRGTSLPTCPYGTGTGLLSSLLSS